MEKRTEQEPDEMSLEDFLAEYANFAEAAENFAEAKAPKQEESHGQRPPAMELAELMEAEAALLRQIAELQEQVWSIRAERRKIEGRMSH